MCWCGATQRLSNKKKNYKKKGRKGKDEPDTLNPSIYPTMVFLLDVEPEIIISRMAHEFGCAGGFYFWKKQLQCKEMMAPFIIYFLYTFNDISTLQVVFCCTKSVILSCRIVLLPSIVEKLKPS